MNRLEISCRRSIVRLGKLHRQIHLPGPRYRPVLELLEARWVLATPSIAAVSPLPNSHLELTETRISAVYDQPLSSPSLSVQSFAVQGSQRGRLLEAVSTLSPDNNTITVSPTSPFYPGELVQVSSTSGLRNTDGEGATPYVWQFRTAVGKGLGRGSGYMRDSGQALGDSESIAVALGDLDGDGDLDAFVANGGPFTDQPDKVWLNDGQATFTDSGQSLGSASGTAVALGDLDGDGDLDAFVGNGSRSSPSNHNRVWLNDGGGSFTSNGQALGSASTFSVALGDVDGDGDLDAFVGNRTYPRTGVNQVWLNDGNGLFSDSGQALGNLGTESVALGDLDGDGDLDAFAANGEALFGGLPNQMWLNDGRGVFANSGQNIGNSRSTGVALGDVDGDGDLDAFVANDGPSELWLNNGRGVFQDSRQELEVANSGTVALGDLDGDGDLDAFIGNVVPRPDKIWLNDGRGNFRDSGQALVGTGIQGALTRGAALGDLDGDGDLDVFAAQSFSGQPDRRANRVWINADIAADITIAMTNGQAEAVPGQATTYTIVVTNRGPGNIGGVTVTDTFPQELENVTWSCTATVGSSCADNGNGDIADTIALASSGTVTYTATGTVRQAAVAVKSITNRATVAGPVGIQLLTDELKTVVDVDAVLAVVDVEPAPNSHNVSPSIDISATYRADVDPSSVSAETFVVHGMQTGALLDPTNTYDVEANTMTLVRSAPLRPGELVQATATRDVEFLNGQGPVTSLVWQFRTAVGVGNDKGSGFLGDSFQRLGDAPTQDVVLGDVDGDGDLDAFVVNGQYSSPAPNEVWLNDGRGNFGDTGRRLGNSSSTSVSLGDVDGDGDLDAIVGNRQLSLGNPNSTSSNAIWLNNGQGQFSVGQRLEDSSTESVKLGDLDGDGDLDVFFANEGIDSVWLNDGSGVFTKTVQSFQESMESNVALGDLDGDGDYDAIVAVGGFMGGSNKVWLNDGLGQFSDSGQSLGDSSSVSVVLGDVDGDGDLDASIGSGSYGPGGVKVWLNNGRAVFRDSGQQLGDFDNFDVQLGDVDGDGDLDLIAGNTAHFPDPLFPVFRAQPNQIWLNNGLGNFTPNGQSLGDSPTQSVALGDLDGDGDLDAFFGNLGANSVWLNADEVAADLAISVTNDQTVAAPGQSTAYTVTVTNDGPQDVTGALVTASISSQVVGVNWICIGSAGTTCAPTGTGDIRDTISIPVGGHVAYSVTGMVDSDSKGSVNRVVARAMAPTTVTDLVPQNNMATDVDIIPPLVNPKPNSNTATTDVVSLMHIQDIVPASVSDRTFAIHGAQTGQVRQPQSSFQAARNTITVSPADVFHPGELMQVTATGAIEYQGEESIVPYVWQYRAAVGRGNGKGTGVFLASDRPPGDTLVSRQPLADLNGDGLLDSISASQLGETFVQAMALGDVDGDGDLDIFVGRGSVNDEPFFDEQILRGEPNKVWLNNGQGQFSDSGQALGDAFARSVAMGDLDGDGDLDALVGNSPMNSAGSTASRVWLNNGQGVFQSNGQALATGIFAIDLGDVDGDGDLDAFLGTIEFEVPRDNTPFGVRNPSPNLVWLNDGQGNLSDSGQRLGNSVTQDVVLGDLDGDGDLDAVVGNSNSTGNPLGHATVSGVDTVWLNDGRGIFTKSTSDLGNLDTTDVALADVDGDGDLDVALSGPSGSEVWLNQNRTDEAVWNGDALTGVPGDGLTWVDANNWTLNGIVDVTPSEKATITFKPAPTVGPINLGQQRTVDTLSLEADYTLEGESLIVVSGTTNVEDGVLATINADVASTLVKNGNGALVLNGTVGTVDVREGVLLGTGVFDGLSVQDGATVSPGLLTGTLSADAATISGTLLAELDGTTSDLFDVNGTVTLTPGSALRMRALGPLGSPGDRFREIIRASEVCEEFTSEPTEGDHLGHGVFVTSVGVQYLADSIWVGLYQASPGDINGDGRVDRTDIVHILQSGTYLTGQPADWTQGDWNGDGRFDQQDLVAMLQLGSFRA